MKTAEQFAALIGNTPIITQDEVRCLFAQAMADAHRAALLEAVALTNKYADDSEHDGAGTDWTDGIRSFAVKLYALLDDAGRTT